MILGTDNSGNVLLVTAGNDPSAMPVSFNGIALTIYVLTQSQENAFHQLPLNRGGTLFDGTIFTALPSPPSQPNPFGFITSCKAAVGGVLNANALQKQYPAFELAVMQGVWSDVQTLILDAQSKGILTPAIYTAFQQAAAANNIPITLP